MVKTQEISMLLEAEWRRLLADYPSLAEIAAHPNARQLFYLGAQVALDLQHRGVTRTELMRECVDVLPLPPDP